MSTANQLREQYESQDRFLHVASAHYGYFLPGIDAIYFMDWAEHCGSKKPRIGTKVLLRPLHSGPNGPDSQPNFTQGITSFYHR